MKMFETLNLLAAQVMTPGVFRNNDIDFGGESAGTIISRGGDVFKVIQTLFTVIGIGIVIFTFWKVVKSLVAAKLPEAFKSAIGGLVAAILCFNLELPIGLVESMGSVFKAAFDTISGLVGTRRNGS